MKLGRPITNAALHYSAEHRHVLAFCAVQANRTLWAVHNLHIDAEELMAEGWWQCLRRCPAGDVEKGIHHTIVAMIRYAVNFYLFHNDRPRAGGIMNEEQEELLVQVPAGGPGPARLCEARDTVAYLRDRLPETFPAAWGVCAQGRELDELARRYGVTGEAIRKRKQRFLAEAQLLTAVR